MEIIFHSHANKTHFHKKGCAPRFILKVGFLELGSGLFLVWGWERILRDFSFFKLQDTDLEQKSL